MDLSSAIGWWEEWQLRVLVLSSAFLQLFLFFTSTKRALAIPSWLRLCIWLPYLGSDALAIYALATLFNRHKAPPDDGASASVLETLWAPVLLAHLRGAVSISAYNMEDNELDATHFDSLVSGHCVAVRILQVLAARRRETAARCRGFTLHHWDHQIQPEAIGPEQS